MEINKRIIVALDFSSKSEVEIFLNKFDLNQKDSLRFVKLGMELYYAEGPSMIEFLKDLGLQVFLDLKVHDIPNTAYGAIKSLAKHGVDIVNVHAAGGIEMMKRAKDALIDSRTKLIAVTQLTSTDQRTMNEELGITGSTEDAVLRLATNTKIAGLDGIVCSPLEVPLIKKSLGKEFLTVCPGIRLAQNNTDDQKRIMTPEQAFQNRADYIVIGRAITGASDPQRIFTGIRSNLANLMES
jgi:orotidine-5'-phosphate decarboxylase